MTVDRDTTLWREPEQREREGGRAVLFVLLGLFALLGGAYVAAYFSASDRCPAAPPSRASTWAAARTTPRRPMLERGLAATVADAEST